MKSLDALVRKVTGRPETQIPGARLARVGQAMKRRLDDDILDVFNRACASDDLDSAADLLAVLERRQTERQATFGHERRMDDSGVRRARDDLERMRRLRYLARPPDVLEDTPAET